MTEAVTPKPRDPLLTAAKVFVVIARIVMIIGIVVLTIGIGAVAMDALGMMPHELSIGELKPILIGLLVCSMLAGIGLLYLGYRFFGELRGIIDSVGEGDPFAPENSVRLSRMGWITVIAQFAILPIAGLLGLALPWIGDIRHGRSMHFGGGLDGGSILLTLILFILARVFREGARMREELEGTV